jgi:hypothetical protein
MSKNRKFKGMVVGLVTGLSFACLGCEDSGTGTGKEISTTTVKPAEKHTNSPAVTVDGQKP